MVMEHFDSMLSSVIDSTLGQRCGCIKKVNLLKS